MKLEGLIVGTGDALSQILYENKGWDKMRSFRAFAIGVLLNPNIFWFYERFFPWLLKRYSHISVFRKYPNVSTIVMAQFSLGIINTYLYLLLASLMEVGLKALELARSDGEYEEVATSLVLQYGLFSDRQLL